MAANFWDSSQYKQLLDQEEVDAVHPLDKERGISTEDFKLIKFHMSNHIAKLAQHIKGCGYRNNVYETGLYKEEHGRV